MEVAQKQQLGREERAEYWVCLFLMLFLNFILPVKQLLHLVILVFLILLRLLSP